MSYNPKPLFDAARTTALKLGVFAKVNGHEPKNPPGQGMTLSMWLDELRPIPTSGLASTSAVLVLGARIQTPMIQEAQDAVEIGVAATAVALVGGLHADLRAGGLLRTIDVFGGESGIRLEGKAGYLTHDQKEYRVFTLRIPMVVNDVWAQLTA